MDEKEEKTYIPARARAVSVKENFKSSIRSAEGKGRKLQAPREKPNYK